MKLLLSLLLLSALFIGLINSAPSGIDELPRFNDIRSIKLTPDNYILAQPEYYQSENQIHLLSSLYLYIAKYQEIANTTDGAVYNPLPYKFTDVQDTISAMAETADGNLYLVGVMTLYKFNIPAAAINSTLTITEYNVLPASGFLYNNRIYFVSTNGQMLYFTHTNNPVNSPNVVFTQIQLGVDTPYSTVVDKVNGYAFIGGENGNISIVNLNTNTFVGEYITPAIESGVQRQAAVVDPVAMELYFCTGNLTSGLSMDVFEYGNISTQNKIFLHSSYQFEYQSLCDFGAFDSVQGQIFFSGSSDTGATVSGIGPRGQRLYTHAFENDISQTSIFIGANSTTKQITIVTSGSQVLTANYTSICEDDCNGNGNCISGVCHCSGDWTGDTCAILTCASLNNCTGNGQCNQGVCLCDPYYMGSANCSVRSCYAQCSGRGSCNEAANYTCSCSNGYAGDYCQYTYQPDCSTFSSSQDCVDHTYCGWCESESKCMEGNRYGPAMGFCRSWYFNQNVEMGVIILAAIFIGLIGILYLIDIITIIPLDKDRAKAYEVEFRTGTYPKSTHEEASILWWRDQRSAKAWAFMDQFQFVSLISHLGVVFPSRFLSFTQYLDWSNLGIPFPPSVELPEENFPDRGRQLLTYAQYNNQLESGSMYHLANIMFWFGILLGAFIIPLLLAFVILKFIESKIHWREVVRNRMIHVLVRILQFSYIGVVMAASFSLVTPPHSYKIIIPGAILLVLYGIGFPVAIWFVLKVPESRLHNPTFKQQFGSLYVNFKPKTDHRFVVFSYIKRFLMAVIIGVLAFNPEPTYPLSGSDIGVPIAQAVVIALAIIAYTVVLIIRKPYFDHYHLWLEYFLAVVNLATVGLCLSHIKSPSVAGELIVCIIQALAFIACIACYIISWLQMKSTFLKKVSKVFKCCGGKGDKTKKVDGNVEMN